MATSHRLGRSVLSRSAISPRRLLWSGELRDSKFGFGSCEGISETESRNRNLLVTVS